MLFYISILWASASSKPSIAPALVLHNSPQFSNLVILTMDLSLSGSGFGMPRKWVEENYQLALKLFMSKSFERSFDITKKLYKASFHQLSNDTIPQALFIKIINLYLTEVGLFIDKANNGHHYKLTRREREEIASELRNDKLLDELLVFYGDDINLIPSAILFNLLLVYYINSDVIFENKSDLLSKFSRIYALIEVEEDPYIRRLSDLYIFRILPDFSKETEAENLIRQSKLYKSSLDNSLKKLSSAIEQRETKRKAAEQEVKASQLRAKEEQQKRVKAEKEQRKKQDLQYQTLNLLKQKAASESMAPALSGRNTPQARDIESLKQRALYLYGISKDYIAKSSPFILLAIIVVFLASRMVNLRRLNLKEAIQETVRMAFQVKYL